MEFVNLLAERQRINAWRTRAYHHSLEIILVLLAPIAPHIAEELWEQTGHPDSVHQQVWPDWDAALAQDVLVQIPVQVDGKVRQVIETLLDTTPEDMIDQLSQPKVQDPLMAAKLLDSLYPGKILSVVTRVQEAILGTGATVVLASACGHVETAFPGCSSFN
jgi:leucyl-tRNA synthetase